LDVEEREEGILEADDEAKTHTETGWGGRYTVTTLWTGASPGRELDLTNCDDCAAIVRLLATLTHETFHRRCGRDPEVTQVNIALLEEARDCLSTDRACYQELLEAFNAEIDRERQQLGSEGSQWSSETLKSLLFGGGVGVVAGAAGGLAAAKIGGAIGSWAGPIGILVGAGAGVAAYAWFNPCE
jgi:hypothetical protein